MTIDEAPLIMNRTKGTKLIFLHIPKTAGTTLKRVIERQYKVSEIGKCYYQKRVKTLREALDRLNGLPKERADEIKIIVGHVGFGVHEYLPWPCSYFTILRDPIDRVISSYYQTRRGESDPLREEARRLSLKDFVSSGLVKAMDNGQTRLLSGAAVEEDLLGKKVEYGRCDEAMLERAKKNLREQIVVGLSERFDESLMLLKSVLGWSSIYYVKANVGRNRTRKEEISKDALRCIEKYNELDLELYRYAGEIFDEAISRQGPLFKRKIGSYRLLNRTYGEARRVMGAIEKFARR
jgi:hypothetical protein